MKVLILGHWIYPFVNPRANRTWELAKGFAKNGADVTVYAVLGDRDYTVEESRYNIKIKNLGTPRLGMIDSQGCIKTNLINKVIGKIVGEYNSWPGVEFYSMIKKCFQKESGVDLLISVANPHIIHWATAEYIDILKPACWIADCGDPFMGNAFFSPHKRYEKRERNWCSKVDYISIPVNDGIKGYYPEYREKIHVIPQGFDNSCIKLSDYTPNLIPTFAFVGSVYPGLRDPSRLMDFIYENNIQCKFVVYSGSKVFDAYLTKLDGILYVRSFLPRKELIAEISKCDFLINISNGTTIQTPSKLIDYAVSKRPILTISSAFDHDEQQDFKEFLKANYSAETKVYDVEKYDIDSVVKQFTDLYYQHVK